MNTILHLIPKMSTGGAERLLLDTLPQLIKNKEFNHILCIFFEEGTLIDEVKNAGIQYLHLGSKHSMIHQVTGLFKLVAYIRKNDIKIIHIHLMLKHVVPLKLVLPGVKVICTLHLHENYRKWLLRQYDSLVACGRNLFNHISALVPDKKVYMAVNAIDVERVVSNENREEIRARLGISRKDIVVLNVGRLEAQKNHKFLLESFLMSHESNKNLLLLIAGGGPLLSVLQTSHSRVRFLGSISDVKTIYRIADIYVNTSKVEGLPLTLAEAMANHLPVIASDIDGNRELQKNNSIVLFKENDIQACSSKILELAVSQKYRNEMGERSYQIYQEYFSMTRYISELITIYKNTISD